MSNVAQKRPFASLVNEESTENNGHDSPPTTLMTPAEKKWCAQTIKSLKKHKRAIAFLDPVDPIKFNIPDYFDIIKTPMDLGTVEQKLQVEQYPTVDDFKNDVQLIFDNCYLYNNPGDPVCQDAKKLQEHYTKLCKKEPKADSNVNTNINQAASNSTPKLADTNNLTQPMQMPEEKKSATTITIPTQPKPQVKLTISSNSLNNEQTTSSASASASASTEIKEKAQLMPEDQFKRCEALVKELKKPKYQGLNWPFAQPVDADAWGATDYYDIIKDPMDMTTYERKLKEFEYSHENELADDIRLMFRNCYTYNPPDHLVHNLGKEFEQVFEKQWAKIHGKSNKRSSSTTSSHSKRQRTSSTDATTTLSSQPNGDVPTNVNNADNNNNGRSTILRLKLSVKPKEEEPPKPKPTVKIPGLALSKEPPPSSTPLTTGPKLAIGENSISSTQDKKPEKSTPLVLQNHDKWLALAKKSSATDSTSHSSQQQQQQQQHNTTAINARRPKEAPLSSNAPIAAISKPKETTTPVASAAPAAPSAMSFDINELYNKIHNEKKLKEQQRREEQEKWERNERLRLEKERMASEERLKQLREFNQHLQTKRKQDKQDRTNELNAHTIDISKQKMKFTKFESTYMIRDQDWREIFTWQRETIDYRHIPVPGFVKRAPIKLPELRKRLLSKCVRLENSKNDGQNPDTQDDGGSDMDVE